MLSKALRSPMYKKNHLGNPNNSKNRRGPMQNPCGAPEDKISHPHVRPLADD